MILFLFALGETFGFCSVLFSLVPSLRSDRLLDAAAPYGLFLTSRVDFERGAIFKSVLGSDSFFSILYGVLASGDDFSFLG